MANQIALGGVLCALYPLPMNKDNFEGATLLEGDALEMISNIKSESIQSVITSPPYWGIRDYEVDGQIGLEDNIDQYLNRLFLVFQEVNRVLKKNGIFWLNIGDTYTSGNRRYRAHDKLFPARKLKKGRPRTPDGLKNKDLIGLPWKIAFMLQTVGWYLRSDIIWHKPNAMPESVRDRPTRCHEYIFMLTKSERYFFNYNEAKEQTITGSTRNPRTVWSLKTTPFNGQHYSAFPIELASRCIISSTREGDKVLDPFMGSGTVGVSCIKHKRLFIGIELNSDYVKIAQNRLKMEVKAPIQDVNTIEANKN